MEESNQEKGEPVGVALAAGSLGGRDVGRLASRKQRPPAGPPGLSQPDPDGVWYPRSPFSASRFGRGDGQPTILARRGLQPGKDIEFIHFGLRVGLQDFCIVTVALTTGRGRAPDDRDGQKNEP